MLTVGLALLAGCQALRGPEPYGPTFVAPPGPVVSGGTVRAVPQDQGVYAPYGAPPYPYAPGPAPYVPGPAPVYTPGSPLQAAPGVPMGGQLQYPGSQSQYAPGSPAPYAPPVPSLGQPPGSSAPAPVAAQATLRITGPTQAIAGATASYRFDVVNGATMSRGVVITCHLPSGWAYVGGNPAAAVSGQQVQWRLGDLPAFRTMAINASFRPETTGAANLCADLATATGTATRSCATTSVQAATPSLPKTDLTPAPASSLDIAIRGPERAAPGEDVTYNITVTNRGSTRATKLLVTDEFTSGFVHEKAVSPIEKDLDDLEPGQNVKFDVTFRVTRPGRHCHTVEVSGDGGLRAGAQACLVAAGSPKLVVRQSVTPAGTTAGGTVRFAIDIENKGDVDLTGLVVSSSFDRALRPTQATEVRGRQALANLKDDRYELTPYRFDRLEPGRSIQLDVECKAERASASACGRVTVTAQEGLREEALTCLKIESGPGDASRAADGAGARRTTEAANPLALEISSSADPAKVGDEVAYLVSVANPSSRTVAGLVLQITMPGGMSQPRAVDANPTRSRPEGQTVVFDPLTLRPGEEAKFRVRAKALTAGNATVEVAATAEGFSATRQRKTTTVVKP